MRFTSDAGVDTFEYYDLETQERVLELEGTWYPPRRDLFPSPPDAPIVFYQGNSQVEKLMGFDPSTKRIVWTKNYQSDPTILGNLNKHMVLGDGTFGITVDVIDPWTGKILHRHRPLMFIAWLLPLVSLALASLDRALAKVQRLVFSQLGSTSVGLLASSSVYYSYT